MAIGAFQERPTRMTLANLETGDAITAQFNPDELKEEIAVHYEKLDVLGLSHKPLQYKNTDNHALSYELGFDGLTTRDVEVSSGGGGFGAAGAFGNSAEAIAHARRFLMHLCYPRKGAQDVSGGGPPRVFMYWPNLLSLTCRITKLSFGHKRFSLALRPVFFSATLTIEEARDVRLFSEDVLESGTLR